MILFAGVFPARGMVSTLSEPMKQSRAREYPEGDGMATVIDTVIRKSYPPSCRIRGKAIG